MPGGVEQLSFGIGPNLKAHPGNDDIHKEYLQEALKIGFKLMKVPRIAMLVNPDLLPEYYATYPDNNITRNVDKLGEIDRKMAAAHCGKYHIQAIGLRYAKPGENWLQGLDNADASEDVPISKAIAEWADGDTVAVHIANGNTILVSNEKSKSGGPDSVFSQRNLSWLEREYGLNVVTPQELAGKI